MLNSGITNIVSPLNFEIGNYYSKFDIIFFTGYTYTGLPVQASQAESGHYYYTGDAATATISNIPTVSNGPWTQDFFAEASYGSTVSYENSFYLAEYGDGYYNYMSKSENSFRAAFNLEFNKRTDKEAKAIVHFLEDSFNKGPKVSGGYTGIYYTPFKPYDKRREFYIEDFSNNLEYPDVNTVSVSFYNENESTTDWKDFYIPFKNTNEFYTVGSVYEPFSIAYGSGVNYGPSTSGWYYYTGNVSVTASSSNGPVGNSSLWVKDTFFFDVEKGISFDESPRFYKQNFQNNYFVRVDDGINKSLLDLKFTLNGRTDNEAKAIIHFLEKHRGKDQFLFTPPYPYNKEKVFICPSFTHSFNFKNNNSISVNFIEQPINYLSDDVEFLNLITIDPIV